MSSADCVLPIELVETIFDYLLDPDCRDALKACSLASRSLSLPSHRRLFRHLSIVIHILPPLFINQRLTSLNSISPIRLSLVQAFSIRLISCNVNFDRNLLLQVLRSMVNLTQITFDCRWTSEPLVSKRNTGVTNADILQECCRPSITHLNLGDCHDFPSDDFYRCTSLTHLTLRNCAFLPPKGRLIALPRIPIKSLFLHTYWLPSEEGRGSTAVHFLRHPLCPWDISCLDSFGFFASKNQQFVELMEFMKYLPDSVTSFSAEIPAEYEDFSSKEITIPNLDISMFPRLSFLKLKLGSRDPKQNGCIRWIASQLANIPNHIRINKLHITVTMGKGGDIDTILRDCDWSSVDCALAGTQFSNLRAIRIRFKLCECFQETCAVNEVERVMREALPMAGTRNLDLCIRTAKTAQCYHERS